MKNAPLLVNACEPIGEERMCYVTMMEIENMCPSWNWLEDIQIAN